MHSNSAEWSGMRTERSDPKANSKPRRQAACGKFDLGMHVSAYNVLMSDFGLPLLARGRNVLPACSCTLQRSP